MARRTTTLELTAAEDAALAALVAWACNNYDQKGDEYENLALMMRAAGLDEIGRVNAALNSTR